VTVVCRIKADLDSYCEDKIYQWTDLSNETQGSLRRLDAARQLVTSLGIETMQP
jgi:hypothetical protein